MATKEQLVLANFEIQDSNEDNAVFKRVVKSRGRSNKEIKKIEKSLPKVTVHYISDEDFNNLKEIEALLIEEFAKLKKDENTLNKIRKHIFKFLEI